MVSFDSTAPGTTVRDWDAAGLLESLPTLDLSMVDRLTVIAAHPDDETLGAGGLIAEASALGIPVRVVVITDGSASHPRSTTVLRDELAVIRQRELFLAVSELSPEAEVVMLGFADGQTNEHRAEIAAALARAIEPGTTLVSPWRGDGHRDHRVVAEICADAAARLGSPLYEYPIWMWHWGEPADERIPWPSAVALPLGRGAVTAKRRALSRHASQLVGLGPGEADGPVLTPEFAAHFERDREVYLVAREMDSGTKSQQYFDSLYSQNRDPWRLGSRWYEERKRALTVASLPRARYSRGLEIGCSVGELTAVVAERCDSLVALDISAAAVTAAAERVAELRNVDVRRADATVDFPAGSFDLIVLSEVAYYWDRATVTHMLHEMRKHLAPGGTIIACHWRHPVDDYPLGGDEVHALIRRGLGLHRIALHDEDDFLLEVFEADARSVAAREGLLG
jgi:LmbE family N-acetylglucosaminyl deacetylase/SAM-dependent methyltransferase